MSKYTQHVKKEMGKGLSMKQAAASWKPKKMKVPKMKIKKGKR